MPSNKHKDLIIRALVWLGNISTQRGIRGCEEVTLGEGYVADAVAICGLQSKWDRNLFKTYYNKARVEHGWIETDDFSFIVEAKSSYSDFRKTFFHDQHTGSRLKPRGNFHFVVVAKGVLPTHLSNKIAGEEVPSFWGILEESRNGVRCIKLPEFIPQPIESLHEIAYRLLRYTKHGKYTVFDLCHEGSAPHEMNYTPFTGPPTCGFCMTTQDEGHEDWCPELKVIN